MNMNAATMRSTLCRYGAQADHFATRFGLVMMRLSLSTLVGHVFGETVKALGPALPSAIVLRSVQRA